MTNDHSVLSRVITVGNSKGGVGKTAVTANIGGLAARSGFRVLLIDLDPQGNLRDELGIRGSAIDDDGANLAAALQSGQRLQPALNVRENLDVLIGGRSLRDVPPVLAARALRAQAQVDVLAQPLRDLIAGDTYDLVLIDTPPGDVLLQRAALESSRWLVIPTASDASSLQAMGETAELLATVRETHPDLDLLGILLFDEASSATALRREVRQDVTAMLGGIAPMFETVIRTSVSGKKARRAGLLVHEYSDALSSETFWEALRDNRKPQNPGTAPALANDLFRLTHEVLLMINTAESVDAP